MTRIVAVETFSEEKLFELATYVTCRRVLKTFFKVLGKLEKNASRDHQIRVFKFLLNDYETFKLFDDS